MIDSSYGGMDGGKTSAQQCYSNMFASQIGSDEPQVIEEDGPEVENQFN